MKSFNNEGICNLDELEIILQDILECVSIARRSRNNKELDYNINIRKLNLNFKDGYYISNIAYNVNSKLNKNDNEERPFKEST